VNSSPTGLARRPANLSRYAEACLQALAERDLGAKISLGDALGLSHYLDYRPTRDADAWWALSATAEDQHRVIEVIRDTLSAFGQVQTRAWGDVVSIELRCEGKTLFSFQIARRSIQLEPSEPMSWTHVLLDSFADLLASKMVALVERGAPRDFRDIYAVCHAGLATPQQCWALWRKRQQLAGSDTDGDRARLAIETHLARIAQHRPLEQIDDARQRVEAQQVRRWFIRRILECARIALGSSHGSTEQFTRTANRPRLSTAWRTGWIFGATVRRMGFRTLAGSTGRR
jgi:hypothetical protein